MGDVPSRIQGSLKDPRKEGEMVSKVSDSVRSHSPTSNSVAVVQSHQTVLVGVAGVAPMVRRNRNATKHLIVARKRRFENLVE